MAMQKLQQQSPAPLDEPLMYNAAQRYHMAHRQEVSSQNRLSRSSATTKRRSNILIETTRDFCRLKRPSSRQIITYKEFFYQFIETLEIQDRRMVSAMLARLNFVPRAIVLFLAMDKLEVAAPLLLFSPVLGEMDLRAIGKKMGEDYTSVIRRRNADHFIPVKKKSQNNNEALASAAIGPAPQSNQDSVSMSNEELISMASKGGKMGKNKSRPQPIEQATDQLAELNIESLYHHARNSDIDNFANEAAMATGLGVEQITRLIKSSSGEELVYFIKALDIPAPKDIQLLMMISPRFGRTLSNFKKAKTLLSELDTGISRMIFNQVGAKFTIPGAPQPTKMTAMRDEPHFAEALEERRREIDNSYRSRTMPAHENTMSKSLQRKAS